MNVLEKRESYVYAHIRDDKNEPFYIGIGRTKNFKRAFKHDGRNSIWNKIIKKAPCKSNILYSGLTWKEACEIEINLIQHFGRINLGTCPLCNLTDGGEGNLNAVFSEERRKKISKALTGKKLSPERVEKCRQRRHTPETIEKIRKLKTGLKASQATKDKMRITNRKGIEASARKISKPVIDLETGVFYNSVKEAAWSLGVTKSHLSGMLLGRCKNWSNYTYA
jgi:hypothetical protein